MLFLLCLLLNLFVSFLSTNFSRSTEEEGWHQMSRQLSVSLFAFFKLLSLSGRELSKVGLEKWSASFETLLPTHYSDEWGMKQSSRPCWLSENWSPADLWFAREFVDFETSLGCQFCQVYRQPSRSAPACSKDSTDGAFANIFQVTLLCSQYTTENTWAFQTFFNDLGSVYVTEFKKL